MVDIGSVKKWIDDVTHNPIFWALIGLLIGLLIKVLMPKDLETGQGIVYVIAILGGMIGLVLGTLYRHKEISSHLVSLEEKVNEFSQNAERHQKLKESLAFLEPAITDDRFLGVTSELAEAYRSIQELKRTHPKCRAFIEWKEMKIFDEAIPKLYELSEHHIVIDNEHRELSVNREFLVQLPTEYVRAVSYQDQGFWDEPEGKSFLEAHSEMIKKKVQITRIFILNADEIESQRQAILSQIKLKIEVRVVEASKLGAKDLEDFVIYDENYVRYAKLVEITETNTLKHATLTLNEKQVKGFIDRFNSLYAKSVEAREFYEHRPLPAGGVPVSRLIGGA